MSQRLQSIIVAYRKLKGQKPDSWILHCQKQKNLSDAIHFAALSENNLGKRHPHQRRLKKVNLQRFEMSVLGKRNVIARAKDFDSILNVVRSCKVGGIGELAIYDTALRIGAYLGLEPQKIYLHAGTRVGTSKLIGKVKSEYINKNQLPAPLSTSNLTCAELEDLLCIFKGRF